MARHMNVGILGGGQLALMLADAATRLKLLPLIFAQSEEEPACKNYPFVLGHLGDTEAVGAFFSRADIVVFENEFLDCDRLRSAASTHGVECVPCVDAIGFVQDKLKQKSLFKQLGIPSPHHVILDSVDFGKSVNSVLHQFGTCVLKWSRMGYDGKGVMVLDANNLDQALAFCKRADALGSEVYAEHFVPFKRELAIVGVFSKSGMFETYPVVVSEQEKSICSRVFGPATLFGLSAKAQAEIESYAEKVARHLSLYGVFAIELFETHDGLILANEIAPRVHNSGHYTQDACECSQFENHLRAVLGMPLGGVTPKGVFAMLNYLGPSKVPTNTSAAARLIPPTEPMTRVHWYGKSTLLPRRKMGHINGVASSATEMPALLQALEVSRAKWFERLLERDL